MYWLRVYWFVILCLFNKIYINIRVWDKFLWHDIQYIKWYESKSELEFRFLGQSIANYLLFIQKRVNSFHIWMNTIFWTIKLQTKCKQFITKNLIQIQCLRNGLNINELNWIDPAFNGFYGTTAV